ncbi:helix-turn-helix domain-containing protein [Tumebacillus permanentifrigoris]|uniref:Zn-dependent peptidase ImmA (M78 family) n=1 Tax=Tumebacillus permanentifrigoris TaxID=378543 RepID=A0A316DBB8_9BACL|nr:XRE family transcriptional regulator [Tumebacillus permanentifrigoris]PWK15028.1 Zn-dependent peptidase ImmA (M78 family) [Tumebacillus permanentifrigoris]
MSNRRAFNGSRLKQARTFRGMTIAELAEETSVTKQAISNYENGKANPSLETLLRLISALGFPRDYFYEEDIQEIKAGTTFFRALLTTNKKDRLSQEEKTKVLSKIYYVLDKYIKFPKLSVPVITHETTPDIESIALQVREHWNLGTEPISNMVHLLEKNGLILTSISTGGNNIDAFSQRQEVDGREFYFVVLGDDKGSAARRQFSAAHELGHIILHDWSTDLEVISREEFREIENEANQFAAAFLLPKESFLNDLIYPNKLDYYIELKRKWRVSISAMVVRAFQLKAINHNQYQYLMRQISKKGWRSQEPLDDVIPIPKPSLLKKAIELLKSKGVLSGDQLIQQLSKNSISLNKMDVEVLLGLEEGTLNDAQRESNSVVIEIKSTGAVL